MAKEKTRSKSPPLVESGNPPRRIWRGIALVLVIAGLSIGSGWYCRGWLMCREAEEDIAHWRNYRALYKTENLPYPFDRSWRKHLIRATAFRRDCNITPASEELDLARRAGAPADLLDEEELLLNAHRGKIEPVRLRYESARDTIKGDTQDYCHSIAMGYLAILEPNRGMESINQWAADHPGSVEPNVAFARILFEGKNYPAAVARLEKTLEVDPDHNVARFLLIQVLGKQNQTQKIFEQQTLLMSYPEHRVVGQIGYADTLARMGRIDEAEESLAELERDFPETKESPRVSLVRAQICLMRGEFQTAATLLERYLKTNPHDLTARFRYGTALNRLGRYKEAEAYMTDYRDEAAATEEVSELAIRVKQFPDDLDAKVDLAERLLTLKEYQGAMSLLSEVFLRDPQHERGYNMMVEHFKKTDQLDKLEKIVRLHDDVLKDKAEEAEKLRGESSSEQKSPDSPKNVNDEAISKEKPSP